MLKNKFNTFYFSHKFIQVFFSIEIILSKYDILFLLAILFV